MPPSKKPQASAYQRAGSKTREEVTSYQKSNSPGFSGEKAAKGSARTEREPGRHRDRNRRRERERKGTVR